MIATEIFYKKCKAIKDTNPKNQFLLQLFTKKMHAISNKKFRDVITKKGKKYHVFIMQKMEKNRSLFNFV